MTPKDETIKEVLITEPDYLDRESYLILIDRMEREANEAGIEVEREA